MNKINSMVRQLFVLFLIVSTSSSYLHTQPQEPIKAYFSPEDQEQIKREFTNLLNGARKQVLVAMYFITDEFFVDHLVRLKQRGIDVQVVIDEESLKYDPGTKAFNGLLHSNIVPLIYPSELFKDAGIIGTGLMHNKFLVVDNTVWTGSANFTKAALDSNSENIVIINSQELAAKFTQQFFALERDAMQAIINLLARYPYPLDPLDWIMILVRELYKKNVRFIPVLKEEFKGLDAGQRDRLKNIFPQAVPVQRSWEGPPTQTQIDMLRKWGVEDASRMTKKQAWDTIAAFKASEKEEVRRKRHRPQRSMSSASSSSSSSSSSLKAEEPEISQEELIKILKDYEEESQGQHGSQSSMSSS